MKSSPNKAWNLHEGKTIQTWKPDEIFPSLTSEGIDSKMEEMLRLFQPRKVEGLGENEPSQSAIGRDSKKSQPVVRKLNLASLENVPGDDSDVLGKYLGVDGIPTGIVLDEEHQLMADAKRQAGETIRNAQAKVKEMLLAARQDVDQIRQDAYNEGRAQAASELQKATENTLGVKKQHKATNF